MDLTDPTAFALAIAEALRREGVDHALYGGLLLAAYGEARETKDADLAVARALARSLPSTLRSREIRVLTPEDFVIFKLLSTRELDSSDAASVVRALGSDLDGDLLRQEVELLARTVPSHPVRERWEQVRARG